MVCPLESPPVLCNPPQSWRFILETSAESSASIILVHNHPTGDSAPSKEDMEFIKRFADCGELLGINLLDHVINGADTYQSPEEVDLRFVKYLEYGFVDGYAAQGGQIGWDWANGAGRGGRRRRLRRKTYLAPTECPGKTACEKTCGLTLMGCLQYSSEHATRGARHLTIHAQSTANVARPREEVDRCW